MLASRCEKESVGLTHLGQAQRLDQCVCPFCPQCGQTPLMIAAEQGSLEIVKELIKNGANCNLEDLVATERMHTRASLSFLSVAVCWMQ